MEYRRLSAEEICPGLFRHFVRRQQVTRCWCRENGEWRVKDIPFLDDWTPEDYETLARCLKNTCGAGGFVCAAFCEGALKGFASVEAGIWNFPAFMCRKSCAGRAWGKSCFMRLCNGPEARGRKGFTSLHTLRWKARPFTGQWAARRRRFAARPMRGAGPPAARWNCCCKGTPGPFEKKNKKGRAAFSMPRALF